MLQVLLDFALVYLSLHLYGVWVQDHLAGGRDYSLTAGRGAIQVLLLGSIILNQRRGGLVEHFWRMMPVGCQSRPCSSCVW